MFKPLLCIDSWSTVGPETMIPLGLGTGLMHSTIGRHDLTHPTSSTTTSEEQILGQYIPLLYHYNMLQDEDRVGAFRQAIDFLVQPGMHVVELGGGTGILSSFAARRGARVTCVERNPELVSCARRFVHSNGLSGQIDVVQADASMFTPSDKVDLVICEMLHVGLLREKQASVISAFKRNYTRVFGSPLPIFVPEASILMVQPVQHDFTFAGYEAPVPLFQAPLLNQPRTVELANLDSYASLSYDEPIPKRFQIEQEVCIATSGRLNAVRFITQNVLAIDMDQQHAMTWANQALVLPIDSPIDVDGNQRIKIAFDYIAGGSVESLLESLRVQPIASTCNTH